MVKVNGSKTQQDFDVMHLYIIMRELDTTLLAVSLG